MMENYVKLPSRYFFSSSMVQACSRNGILKYKFKELQWFAPRTNKTEESFDWFFKLNSQALIIQSFEGFKRGTKCEAKWDPRGGDSRGLRGGNRGNKTNVVSVNFKENRGETLFLLWSALINNWVYICAFVCTKSLYAGE